MRETLLRAMDGGHWTSGDQLPTEAELTLLTPFSLGTVQRAVRSLVEDGLVVRRRGHGSFVTDQRARMHDPLHFWFVGGDGATPLPVFPKVLSRRRETRPGPWAARLGAAGRSVLRIDRLLGVGGEFSVYSRFYVAAGHAGALGREPLKALASANFSRLLAREMHVPVSRLYQQVCAIRLPDEICRAIGVKRAAAGLLVEIAAYAAGGETLYCQEIFVPPTARRLVLSGRAGAEQAGASRGK
ncbi:MAG: GntR family transcriptional regulator [Burkholderiales bacterium]